MPVAPSPGPNRLSAGRHRSRAAGPVPRRVVAVAAVAVVTTVAVVLAVWPPGDRRTSAGSAPTSAGASAPSVTASALATAFPSTSAGSAPTGSGPGSPVSPSLQTPVDAPASPATPAVPDRVQVPSVGISSTLERLSLLKDGTMQPPSQWNRAGWYAAGVRPGEVGPAVIAGHFDSHVGPAVFYRLGQVRTGATVVVSTAAGQQLRFTVTGVRHYPKSTFPTNAVYGPTAVPELRLITCSGDFDYATGHYIDNLVVSAVLDD